MGGGGGVNLSEIAEDILLSVVNRLHTVTDYFHLNEVCKSWRTINTCSPHNCLIPQPPFLMLAEPKNKHEDEKDATIDRAIGHRGFVGLNNNDKVYELDLPELYDRRCVGSTGNWLITVNKEQQVHIFNPFTRTQFQLPSYSGLHDQYDIECEFNQEELCGRFLRKVVLSSPPAYMNSANLNDVVAIACYGTKKRLAIARPGDESWTAIEVGIPADLFVHDVIFFKDKFYFVNYGGMVAYYDISCSPLVATHVSGELMIVRYVDKYYLVECMGELLLVRKYITDDDDPYYKTDGFQVSKFNFDRGEWEDVKSFGQHSLFLGYNTSVSLFASDSSTFRGNCIYFTDDYTLGYIGGGIEGGTDMGVFDLEDGTIKPHYAGISTSWYSPPLWIIPKLLHQS